MLAFAVLVSLWGCEEKIDEDTIMVDKTVLDFPEEGGTLTFNITCPMEWDIINDWEKENFVFSQSHGSGNQEVSVTLEPNTFRLAKQKLIAVRAANGAIKNIWINQNGKGGSEKLFDVVQDGAYISGKEGAETYVLIICLTPRCFWVMECEDDASWLEVSMDGGYWRPAAEQMVSTNKEGVDLIFRARSDNKNMKDRSATFTVNYGTDKPEQFTITQLGKSRASINRSAVLANSIAVDWNFGCEVDQFYTMASDQDISLSNISSSAVRKWTKKSATDSELTLYDNLNENTKYWIYVAATDKDGGMTKSRRSYTTGSSKNQAAVNINPIGRSGDAWKWTTSKNSMAKDYNYYMWVTDDQLLFNLSDAALAWYIRVNETNLDLNNKDMEHSWEGNAPFMVVTWALTPQGVTSGIISRKIIGQ